LHQFEVDAGTDAQAALGDAVLDHLGPADQDGLRQASSTTTCTARSTRSSSPSAEDDALVALLGRGEHRLHQQAGVIDELCSCSR
jgi:hypothetical protein